MTHDATAMAQFSSIVTESTLEELKAIGLEASAGPAPAAAGNAGEEIAAFVAIWGANLTATVAIKTRRALVQHAGAAPDGDLHHRFGELAASLAARVVTRCKARGRDVTAGTPCTVSGAGLAMRTSAAGGQLAFVSNAGPLDVALDLHVSDGAALYSATTILVIDDSEAIRQEVAALLTASGHRVIEACDGADGLDKLAANPDIAIACCDMNMPNMDGLTFVEKAKQRYRDKTVPIVMLTSETRTKLCSEALKKGAVGWIIKPFQPQELVATVQKLVRRTAR